MPHVSKPDPAVHRQRARASGTVRPSPSRLLRSRCPVSCTLDLIGDRWSLLVVRDMIRGKRRFGEFLESPESIPTNILTERLKRLVRAGIVRNRRYCSHPPRMEYLLTPRGEELRPIVRAMVDWGIRHAGGRLPQAPPAKPAPPRVSDPESPAPSRPGPDSVRGSAARSSSRR